MNDLEKPGLTTSILIASYKRPRQLVRCLVSLRRQERAPDEVIIVCQADDWETKAVVERLQAKFPFVLKVPYCARPSIVEAVNAGLLQATGDIICLIDDDAVAPRQWLAKMLPHYLNPRVGAVGGPVQNFSPAREPFPINRQWPPGKLCWFGKILGNMHDLPPQWAQRNPLTVDHLMGSNMSLRRSAFHEFENSLRTYWQYFELDACLQVRSTNRLILFDFSNRVKHFPGAEQSGRCSTAESVWNCAYNRAFVLSKHTVPALRIWRLLYLVLLGTRQVPGLLMWPLSACLPENLAAQWTIIRGIFFSHLAGWQDGAVRRHALKIKP
jgi:glycosyltransferase involved in cell wall biosynthesis